MLTSLLIIVFQVLAVIAAQNSSTTSTSKLQIQLSSFSESPPSLYFFFWKEVPGKNHTSTTTNKAIGKTFLTDLASSESSKNLAHASTKRVTTTETTLVVSTSLVGVTTISPLTVFWDASSVVATVSVPTYPTEYIVATVPYTSYIISTSIISLRNHVRITPTPTSNWVVWYIKYNTVLYHWHQGGRNESYYIIALSSSISTSRAMVTVLDIKSFKWKLECIAVEETSPPEPSQRKKIGCNWTSPWVILHNNRKNSKKLNKIIKNCVWRNSR